MKSRMWQYIKEEAQVLKNALGAEDVREVMSWVDTEIEAVYFVSHGSSFNAATVASNFLSAYANVRVYCYTPGNFLYNCTTIDFEDRNKTLVISISQTGTSRGTLEAVEKAKRLGFKVLGITDVEISPLYAGSDYQLLLHCGEEKSNAKTKGYSATLVVLLRFAVHLACKKRKIGANQFHTIYHELLSSIEELPDIFARTVDWCKATKFGNGMKNVFVLGCGMNYGTALEGQLKLMETMCMPAAFNDIEEFPHGMHRAINQNSSVILLNCEDSNAPFIEKTFRYLRTKTDKVMMINAQRKKIKDPMVINIQHHPYTQSVLGITMVIQILSLFIPEINGLDPNRNANNDYTKYMSTRVSV